MSKNLLIVESPAKAKTIGRYLGTDFRVLASYGHVRDLTPKEGAVDTEHGFAMRYELIEKNVKHVNAIAETMRKSDALYLATDLDREGEAISWHLVEILKEREVLDNKPVYRVIFHEITKRAIEEAIRSPRVLSVDLVNAQQARRALDYLVGFNLSPLLWRKIRRGLSAGRVQSPALRMIVEREEEIEAFEVREYWTVEAQARQQTQAFSARLAVYQGEKLKQFSIVTSAEAEVIRQNLLTLAQGWLSVGKVEKKQRKRLPPSPFITSTLQQEGARKLGFTTQRTMRIAQQLYEGIDIGGGLAGLITYMRTDSVSLAGEALEEIRDFIRGRFGAGQAPAQARRFKTQAKNAQEAHEAIRPTAIQRTPEDLMPYLSEEQYRLYDLIWKRTLACQMIDAIIDTVAVDLTCGAGVAFRATGSTVVEPGFMAVYLEGKDDGKNDSDEGVLPAMKAGDRVQLADITATQHFTEPPPRYTEASLVRSLEEHGIGRPSTYAAIISTLQQREYATLESKRFKPTDVGRIVSRFLTEHFTDYVDYGFTARLEDELDAVSRGERSGRQCSSIFGRHSRGWSTTKPRRSPAATPPRSYSKSSVLSAVSSWRRAWGVAAALSAAPGTPSVTIPGVWTGKAKLPRSPRSLLTGIVPSAVRRYYCARGATVNLSAVVAIRNAGISRRWRNRWTPALPVPSAAAGVSCSAALSAGRFFILVPPTRAAVTRSGTSP